MTLDGLLEEIEKASVITIFRHENPDCDAVGSQYGLKNWIEENWKDKQVYACGMDACTQGIWPELETLDDDVIRQSLAIVLDTANAERVDDKRFETAKKIIKIDHHPNREPFGDVMYVFDKAAATCEILASFMKACSHQKVSTETASYLYKGLLTDTLNYTTSNTTADTLEAGAFLAGFHIDIPSIGHELWDRSEAEWKFDGWVRSHVQIYGDHIAWCRVTLEDLARWHMDAHEARTFVNAYANVHEFEIWAIFTEVERNGEIVMDGSLRSRTVVINGVAEKYQGGGHKNACGVKNLNDESLAHLLADLNEEID